MTRRSPARLTLTALAVAVLARSAAAGDLAGAQALYAAAAYEEALTALGPPSADGDAIVEANQLRALCLLALGRAAEAGSAVERLVRHDPIYTPAPAEVSPKLVALFRDVRQRMLPSIVRAVYAQGRAHVDARRWDEARGEFSRLTTLLAGPEFIGRGDTDLNDLRLLAEGFLELSRHWLANQQAAHAGAARPAQAEPTSGVGSLTQPPSGTLAVPSASAPAQPSTPSGVSSSPSEGSTSAPSRGTQTASTPAAANPAPSPATPSSMSRPAGQTADRRDVEPTIEPPTFSALDQDVSPPVELLRRMPRWSPSDRAQSRSTFQGLLEIVIDEKGVVESASMARSVTRSYDEVLVQAALGWRFNPAKKDGRPVRYRQVLEIVLRPTRID